MPIRLGYDSYSIRALKLNAMQHLDYAAQQKLDALQFSGSDVYESFEPAYLAQIKRRAEELGIKLDAGVGCICELSKSWNAKDGTPAQVLNQGLQVARHWR